MLNPRERRPSIAASARMWETGRTRFSGEMLRSHTEEREAAGLPFADVDIALHVGEVLYGNVGAADRLDFTVIGPAVNEVVRIEKLCERLNRQILFSSRFAEAAGRCDGRLKSLGQFELRGVGEPKEIFGLRLPPTVALQLGPA